MGYLQNNYNFRKGVPQNDYSITFLSGGGPPKCLEYYILEGGGGSLQMITIDYIEGGGSEKTKNWLRNTWTAPNTYDKVFFQFLQETVAH